MNTFHQTFAETFGEAWPGQAIDLSLPRLRFELAVGRTQRERLKQAEQRCIDIFSDIFRSCNEVWTEFLIWDVASQEALAYLVAEGLEPIEGSDWSNENVVHDDPEAQLWHFWTRLQPNSRGLSSLVKVIMWADFGGWEETNAQALFFDPVQGIGYWPYDDRGADVFAKQLEILRPYYHKRNGWILEYDRPRIDRELTNSDKEL